MALPQSPFGHEITTEEIVAVMQQMRGWEERYRQVIQWGKKLPVMPEALKQENVTVAGCESQVWLVAERRDGQWFFCADSDARIVRGLITLVLAAYDGRSADEIQAFDIETYFGQLGLVEHLSASRGNGLRAIVDTIKQQVA